MGFLRVIRRLALRDKMPIRKGAVEPRFKSPPRASKLDPYADRWSAWLLA